ncbi:golgin subfamily A member 4-like isoform X3 [Cimex lectularius]|uniref:Uncharacterized protein n=1 Tax=Cimex lectularius TaxID=79782 RepID=A0A8I6S1D1_CIMLE|nr:golgin subfamily A member 4-like isoform X3 [Cimex lectularius]
MSDGDPTLNPAGNTLPSPTAIREPDNQQKEAAGHDDSCADNDLTCSEYLSLASDNPTLETASAATSNDQNDSDCSDFLDAREGGKEKYAGHSRRSSLSSVVDGFLDECMNKVEEHERLKENLEKEEATEPLQNNEHEESINNDHEGLKDTMEKTEKASEPLKKGEHEVVIYNDHDSLKNDTEKTEDPSEPLQNFENEKNIRDVHDTLKNNVENTEKQSETLQNSEHEENINNDQEVIKDSIEKVEEPSETLESRALEENINNDRESLKDNMEKVEEPSETLQKSDHEETINKESLKENMEKAEEPSETPQNTEHKVNINNYEESHKDNMAKPEKPSEALQNREHEENINKDQENLTDNMKKPEKPSEALQKREHEENINKDQENLTDNMKKTEEQSEPLQNIKHEENVNNDPLTVQEDEGIKKELHLADDFKVEEVTIKLKEAPTENLPGIDTVLDDHKIETRGQEETELESKETNCSNQKDTNLEQSDLMDDKQTDSKSSQFQLEMEKEGFSLGCNLSLTTVFDEKGLAISENEKICEIREIVSKLEMPHVLEKNLNLKVDPNEMANTITNNIMAKIAAKKSQTSIIADNSLAKENLEYTEMDKTVEKEEQDMETSVPEPDVLEKTVPERPSLEKEQAEHPETPATETLLEKTEMPEPVVNEVMEQKFDDFRALNEVQELCNDLVNTVAGPMTPSEMKMYKTFSDVKPQKNSADSCGDLFSPVIQSPTSVYEYEPAEETCKESLMESNETDTLERKKGLVAGEDNVHTLLNTQSTDRTELSQREKVIPLIEAKKDKPSEENTELPVKDSIPESSPSEGQQANAEEDVVQEPCTFFTSNLDKYAAEYTQEQPQGQLEVEAEKSETMEKASSRPKRNEGIIKMVEKTEQSGSGIQSSITYKKVVRSNRIPVVKAESPTRMKPVAPKPSPAGCSENANRSLVQNATLLSLKERIDAVRNKRHELSPKLKQGKGEDEKAERKQNASPTRKDKENAFEDSNEETVEQFGKEENPAQLDSKAQELRNEEAECLEEDEAAEEEMENNLMSSSVKSLKTCSDGRTYKKSQPPLPPGKLSALMTRYRTQLKRYNTHLADFEAYQARIKTARENLRIIQGQMIASSGDGPEGFTVPELPPNVVCNPPVPSETLKQLENENKKLKESMHKKSEELVLHKEKLTVLKNDVKALEEKIAVYESGSEKPKVEESEKHARFHAQMSKLKQQLEDEIAERASLEKKKNNEVTSLSNKIKCEISKREQLQKSLVHKAEEIDKVLSQMKELKLEKANLQSTLDEQSFLLETFKKQTQKMAEEMAMKEEKLNTIENCLQEERKLNNDLKDRLENSEKERAESCQRIMQLSDLLVEKGDQIEENAELLSKEHARSNKLAELIRHVCNCVGCDIDSEMLRILMNSDVDGQENICNKIKTDVENVNNERKEDLLRKDVTISSLRAELKEKQKLIDELLEFADVKNAGVCKKTDDEDRESTTFKREEANIENSLLITTSKEMQRVNTQELMELLETKRHAMQRMEKQIKDLQDLHSYCGMRRTLQESKIAELELTLAGYLD